MRGAPGAAAECPGPAIHCCWGLPHAPCCTPQTVALHQVSHIFQQLGHCHQQLPLQAAVTCLALVPATLQPLSTQTLAISHRAGAVTLELLSRLSVLIMSSSRHAMYTTHQTTAVQAPPSFMRPCHCMQHTSHSQAACLFHTVLLCHMEGNAGCGLQG